ncbi:hypothetical protein FQN53_000519 [Emmonsiellopsis sp. PD_33]|nr:hypothetical protein FQN53_000519 [Emmonsiellopsis sp. PD_33]
MPFNGYNQQQRREVQLRPDDIVIPVMGVTGSGKSTFISLLADGPSAVIGHSLKGCKPLPPYSMHTINNSNPLLIASPGTKSVEIYPYQLTPKTRIILLDTPSFNEASGTDIVTLRSLASFLSLLYTHNIKIAGLIYLHDISTRRMHSGAQRSLRLFKKLVGPGSLSSTILATNMWGKLTEYREGTGREKQLCDGYWDSMLARGSTVMRHSGSRRSAEQIVRALLRKSSGEIVLNIQRQMVLQREQLSDTGAGQELYSEMREERYRYAKEMAALRLEIDDAGAGRRRDGGGDGGRALRESRARLQEKIRMLEEGRRALRVDFQRLKGEVEEEEQEVERRRKKGFGKTALGIGIGTLFGLTTGIFF